MQLYLTRHGETNYNVLGLANDDPAADVHLTARGIGNVLQLSSELGILATPVALLMIGGESDLSIGSTIGFAGVVIGMGVTVFGLPLWAAILIAFGFAIVIGNINGILLIKTGLPSFIVTLAAMFILRGLTLALTRGITGRTQIDAIMRRLTVRPR